MKKLLPLILYGLLVGSRCFAADSVFSMNITEADVQRVLPLYHDISGLELVVASNVKHVYVDITVDYQRWSAIREYFVRSAIPIGGRRSPRSAQQ